MKKMFIILALFCATISVFSQSAAYLNAKRLVVNEGYTIADERYAYVAQNEYLFNNRTFYGGTNYIIVAASDDSDVLDIDIYLYYQSGSVRNKDDDADRIAVINFTPNVDLVLQISVLNYKSLTPRYKSLCRYFIAYK